MSDRDPAVEKRAYELQAVGPDEYPFGYYYHLAEQEAQEQPEAAEVEATGMLEDGIIKVSAKLGNAELSLRWPADDEGDEIDLLVNAAGTIAQAVVARLVQEQEADR